MQRWLEQAGGPRCAPGELARVALLVDRVLLQVSPGAGAGGGHEV